MPQFSKLQIRAKVLSVISEIKSLKYHNEEELVRLKDLLNDIDDKKTVFDIFLKEYVKLDENEYIFCSYLLISLVPVEYITEKSIEILKSQTLSDEYKYKIVQLLRITGGNYNYAELPDYFENPQEVLDLETKRLLDTAVFNPESMLDFLDFISAVSENDKSILLKSLSLDYKGDTLANIVYPVLYSDFSEKFILQAIEVLSESKSSLAIAPFEYLIKVSDSKEIVNACQLGLKKLKLAGVSKEKAEKYFKIIVKTSAPAEYFVTIPDGSGKQALLTTRKHDDGKYSLAAIVISDLSGIVDCFGFFRISQEEVIKIINKFYNSEGQYIVPKEYVKSRINFAQDLTIKNKFAFPYEFICWSPMFRDIQPLISNIDDYVDENSKFSVLSKEKAVDLLSEEYTLRWFITPNENEYLNKIINDIYSEENLDIFKINTRIAADINNIFDEKTVSIWKDRFYNLIFILIQNNKSVEANEFYTILKNNELFNLFKQIIMQRSVFNYFAMQKENEKNSFFTTNIFKKRNKEETKYDVKKLNMIIEILKRGWLGI